MTNISIVLVSLCASGLTRSLFVGAWVSHTPQVFDIIIKHHCNVSDEGGSWGGKAQWGNILSASKI